MPQKKLTFVAKADPLTEEEARTLLDPVDVIRDPLHGDIRLTALERHLIDTPQLQRLRGINQLGMTYVAYPGALHNRFLHSVGTLHICYRMIVTCNANAKTYRRLASPEDPVPLRINSYTALLARLCALLHDLAHVPFGHTLEREGRVFERDEWQDPERREKLLLGEEAPLAEVLRNYFGSLGLRPQAADAIREEIKVVLMTKRSEVTSLSYPFVHDLVGNTICADLLDYVQRDMYFCGLDERFATRFLEYLAIIPVAQEENSIRPIRREDRSVFPRFERDGTPELCRVVLLQYRYNERRLPVIKHDVISEAIDLVRRRLAVAEKLYYHRTKMSASAMLVSAFLAADNKATDIWDLSDTEVLKLLQHSPQRRAKVLAEKLRSRTLFKPIYRASYHEADDSHASLLLWDKPNGAYHRYKNAKQREELAARLETVIGICNFGDPKAAVGTVSICCPDADMNLKAFDMLVLPRPGAMVRRLQDSGHPPTKKEIEAIIGTHKHLWRLEVFVDPEIVPLRPEHPLSIRLAGAIQCEIGPKNEIEGFGDAPAVDLAEWEQDLSVTQVLTTLGVYHDIKHEHFEELKRRSFRNAEDRLLAIRAFLKEKGYGV